ncbi:MAG: NAD-dependent aldehyde dehydrogenase, partial [Myxococcota bacterium]|nr:NAD-dependent aldehyde dehydrogenase [Myxococcota bacterium]
GFVHNTFLLDHPQKSVVRAPFRMNPIPPWFPNHRTLAQLGERVFEFDRAPSVWKVPGVAAAAMRG